MRLRLELNRQPQMGTSNSGTSWIRLAGIDKIGRFSQAVAFGFTADKIKKELFKVINPQDDVALLRTTVDLVGEWKDASYINAQGKTSKSRQFEVTQFEMVMGPVLELERIQRDTLSAFHKAEAARAEGDFRTAYMELLQQAGRVINKVDAVNEIVAELATYEDPNVLDDFSAPGDGVSNSTPEAEALKKFASINGVEEKMELAATEPSNASAETSAETLVEAVSTDDDDLVFGDPDDEVLEGEVSQEPEISNDEEIDVVSEEPDGDVLDDEPSVDAEEQAAEQAEEATVPAPSPAQSGMSMGGRPRPMSGGFGRPMGGMGGMGRPR